jgi:hypothetical protein
MKIAVTAILFTGIAAMMATGVAAEPWKIDANASLSTALNTYSDDWTGGEAGSFTWTSQFLGTAERQISKSWNSKATLKLQFGQTKLQNNSTKHWSAAVKSTDLIDGEELLRATLGSFVDPFVSVRAISQFVDGSDSLLVRYGNPWDITEALGGSRTLRKSATIDWSTRIGVAARQLVDRDKPDSTGSRATDLTNDGGVEFDMDLNAATAQKWVTLLSSLRLYDALVSSKADALKGTPGENYWRYPHMKWENTLTLAIAKYLMLDISAYAYYDRDISNEVRLKETFSAGLTYIYSRK